MATAKTAGVKLGTLGGKGAAGIWNITCRIASATGDFGEGLMEGSEIGWDAGILKEEQRKLEVKAKMIAFQQQYLLTQAAQAAPLPVMAPTGKKAATA